MDCPVEGFQSVAGPGTWALARLACSCAKLIPRDADLGEALYSPAPLESSVQLGGKVCTLTQRGCLLTVNPPYWRHGLLWNLHALLCIALLAALHWLRVLLQESLNRGIAWLR